MKKLLFLLPTILLLAAGCSSTATTTPAPAPSPEYTNITPPVATNSTIGIAEPPPAASATPVQVTITGKNYSFDQSTIRVKKGQIVTLTFKNTGGSHDFVLDDFNVKSPILDAGQSADITFTADKVGTFEYYCSVGNHRQMGMKGQLVVE